MITPQTSSPLGVWRMYSCLIEQLKSNEATVVMHACRVKLIGALSEPHLVSSTAAPSIYYIFISHIVRLPHVITYPTRAQTILVPRSKPSFPGLHLMEIAHAFGMDYQGNPYREARLAVAISSLEVPSICDSADRSPTLAEAEMRRYPSTSWVQTLLANTVITHN